MISDEFRKELEHLINKHSVDSELDMPDFVLSEYLVQHLKTLPKLRNKKAPKWIETERLQDERNQMLKDLEEAGWPCRLAELPREYVKLARVAEELRAQLSDKKRDESNLRHTTADTHRWSKTKISQFVAEVKGEFGAGWRTLGRRLQQALIAEHALRIVIAQTGETVKADEVRLLREAMLREAGLDYVTTVVAPGVLGVQRVGAPKVHECPWCMGPFRVENKGDQQTVVASKGLGDA